MLGKRKCGLLHEVIVMSAMNDFETNYDYYEAFADDIGEPCCAYVGFLHEQVENYVMNLDEPYWNIDYDWECYKEHYEKLEQMTKRLSPEFHKEWDTKTKMRLI